MAGLLYGSTHHLCMFEAGCVLCRTVQHVSCLEGIGSDEVDRHEIGGKSMENLNIDSLHYSDFLGT